MRSLLAGGCSVVLLVMVVRRWRVRVKRDKAFAFFLAHPEVVWGSAVGQALYRQLTPRGQQEYKRSFAPLVGPGYFKRAGANGHSEL